MGTITGTDNGEPLTGTAGDDTINALGGDDQITITTGVDTIDGGTGNDILRFAAIVLAQGTPHSYTITANRFLGAGGTIDTTFSNIERITISEPAVSNNVTLDASGFAGTTLQIAVWQGTHTLTGGAAVDLFSVNMGSATVDGGAGLDRLTVGSETSSGSPLTVTHPGDAVVFDRAGFQTVTARNVENFTIQAIGSASGLYVDASQLDVAITLIGSPQSDVVVGGSANDSFRFFSQGDLLAGLGGADAFSFESLYYFGGATILDLDASDTISFINESPIFIGSNSFSGNAGEYRYSTFRGETFLIGDLDGDGRGDSTLTIANGAFDLAETSPGNNILHIAGVKPPLDPADNMFDGTGGNDTIETGAGNDTINALGGNDLADGGTGNDTINGGAGDDQLYGFDGDDMIDGGTGQDFLYGEDGNDTLTDSGGTGDWLIGGLGDDTLVASDGVYNMFGDDADSEPLGGNDHITLTNGGSGSWLVGEGGDDVISAAGSGMVTLQGGAGNDDITVTGFSTGNILLDAGNDTLHINPGTFTVNLIGGQDTIVATSTGNGRMDVLGFSAGEQGDRLDLSIYGADPFTSGVLTMSANGPDTVIDHPVSGTSYVLQGVLKANLSAYNLGVPNPNYAPVGLTLNDPFSDPTIAYSSELVGADGNDTIRGYGGDDTLFGSGGNDLLLPGTGTDFAFGGSGNDGIVFGGGFDATDYVDGGAGTDDQLGLQGNYSSGVTFGANSMLNIEALVLLPGNDTRFGDTAGNFYSYNLTTVDANVAAGQLFVVNWNTLRAGENVTFNGSAETNGSFLTYGGAGNDTITGGAQVDGFYFGGGRFGAADTLVGGAGNDQLGLQGDYSATHALFFGAGQLTSIETIVLLSGADTRFGGGGLAFNYALQMDDGNVAAGATMTINANTLRTNEQLNFHGENETDGRFVVYGGGGQDYMIGGSGNDVLYGGGSADNMMGGAGNDTYLYLSATNSTTAPTGMDQVFWDTGDKFDLSAIDANSATGTNDAFTFIGANAFSHVAGELRAANSGTGLYYIEGDVDGDGVADLTIAIHTYDTLTSADFVL